MVNGQNAQNQAEYEAVYTDRIQVNTVNFEGTNNTDSKKIQSPNQYRVSDRISPESETDTKKVRTPNPSRVKTNMYKSASKIQLEESTSMAKTTRKAAPPAGEMVVDSEMILDSEFEQESNGVAETNMLCQFGFDPQTAASLAEKAFRFGKDGAYIEGILRYARENARQNPLGLARYLIERGEDRLSKSARWQQQSMFAAQQAQPEAAQAEVEAEEAIEEAQADTETAPVAADPHLATRANLARMHGLNQTDLDRWNGLLQVLAFSGPQNAVDLFRCSVGYVDAAGNLRVILRSLFDQRRAVSYREQLERVIVRATGKMPNIEFEY